jgi:hypothetical protein
MTSLSHLLAIIDRAYDRASWHGTNLRGSVRRMTAPEAAWRPAPGRHNAWEIVVHAAYWKYVVRRRLTGEPRGSFPLKGSDWFVRPAPASSSEVDWAADLALLDEMHAALRRAAGQLRVRDLPARAGGSSVTTFDLVAGIAAHDLYHAGQIQLLKRLHRR